MHTSDAIMPVVSASAVIGDGHAPNGMVSTMVGKRKRNVSFLPQSGSFVSPPAATTAGEAKTCLLLDVQGEHPCIPHGPPPFVVPPLSSFHLLLLSPHLTAPLFLLYYIDFASMEPFDKGIGRRVYADIASTGTGSHKIDMRNNSESTYHTIDVTSTCSCNNHSVATESRCESDISSCSCGCSDCHASSAHHPPCVDCADPSSSFCSVSGECRSRPASDPHMITLHNKAKGMKYPSRLQPCSQHHGRKNGPGADHVSVSLAHLFFLSWEVSSDSFAGHGRRSSPSRPPAWSSRKPDG